MIALFRLIPLFAAGGLFAELLPIRSFTTLDGLAHNHINRIKTDSHGFLWFCTDAGLSRFDGKTFFNLTTADGLPHPDVNDIVEDREGTFWLATDGGISRFRPQSPATREKPKIETFRPEERPDEHFDAVEFDLAGRLWAGGQTGLYLVDRSQGVRVTPRKEGMPSAAIPRILASRRGGLWIATRAGALYRGDDGRITRVRPSPHGQKPFDTYAESLLEDRSGRLWIGYRTGGFCRSSQSLDTDPIEPEFCLFERGGQTFRDVRAFLEAPGNRIWAGTSGDGLCEIDPESRSVRCHGKANGLTEARVLRIATDSEGNVWMGTGAAGIMMMPRTGFSRLAPGNGYVSSLPPWLSHGHSQNAVAPSGWLEDASPLIPQRRDNLLKAWRREWNEFGQRHQTGFQGALQDSRGRWWIYGGLHLYVFPAGAPLARLSGTTPLRLPLKLPAFYEILHEDSQGRIWAATKTIGPVRRTSGHLLVSSAAGAAFQEVPEIREVLARLESETGGAIWVSSFQHGDDGSLWLGIAGQRRVYESRTVVLLRYRGGQVEEFTQEDGLPGAMVNALYLDRSGRLWVATHRGLAFAEAPHSGRPRFTQNQELHQGEVWSLTEDSAGRIYAGTANGVEQWDPARGVVHRLTAADGLGAGPVLAAGRGPAGELWFATVDDLARLNPGQDFTPKPPRVFTVSPTAPLRLSHDRSSFEAEFAAPSFSGSRPRFQYRLIGQNTGWSAPVSEGIVRYAGMAPGTYELQARAVNAMGETSAEPASVRFEVLPPLWRTWWFLALSTLAAGGLAYAAHRYRVRQLLAVERLRLRMAADLHDDIGSSLSQISMLGELARRALRGTNPEAETIIDRMATASREAVTSIGDIVWSIHPNRDHAGDLGLRMRHFASGLLEAKGIEFDFIAPAADAPQTIPLEIRRDLMLIFKESIHNAARHSGCARVRAELSLRGGRLRLFVEDDGAGISSGNGHGPASGGGHGLTTMRLRAERLGGKIRWEAGSDGRGTLVTVEIPTGTGGAVNLGRV